MFWGKKRQIPLTAEEQIEEARKIAGEQIALGESMKKLVENDDFKKVFYDFRVKQYLDRAQRNLVNALMVNDIEAVAKIEEEMKKLVAIDWYIETILSYYTSGRQTLEAIYEEGNHENQNNY